MMKYDSFRDILIRNGKIWDGNSFEISDILIRDGIISEISNNIKENVQFSFDAKGMIISSSLTDVHTHIKGISPSDIGIECGKISCPFGTSHLIDASAEMGDISNTESECSDIYVLARVYMPGGRVNIEPTEDILKKYSKKVIGLKVYFDTNFAPLRDIKPLKEVCEYANERNLFVMVHTTDSPTSMFDIVNALNKGDIISHAFHGGKNSAAQDDFACLEAAKEKGILLDSAFSVNYHIDYSIFEKAIERHILPDYISSDITSVQEYVGNEKYSILMCMSIARKCGMKEEDIFRSVTVNPMKLLRGDSNKGYVKVGDKADIALFKLSESNTTLTDRYNNTLTVDKSYKCYMTVKGNTITTLCQL